MKIQKYSFLVKLIILVTVLCSITSANKNNYSNFNDSKCLNVPISEFAATVSSTITTVHQVATTVSKFPVGADFRLNNAVLDCLDLMDFTVDQLYLALNVSRAPTNGKYDAGAGDAIADIKTWLSGAMTNQDTCREGLDGTTGNLKNLISGDLDAATSLVHDLLSAVKTEPTIPKSSAASGGGRKLSGFPDWVNLSDRRYLQASNGSVTADVVVAADGTGDFKTIEEAVKAAPENNNQRYVIRIKSGVYRENVELSKKKWNIMMIGDGAETTVISGDRNVVDGWTTYRSATFAVKGRGFIARDITFENTAGSAKHQAVAYRSDSDLSMLYHCTIRGFQDTLYAHSQRQFYRQCTITGTIDFIFGDATAVFQDCDIHARQGLPNQKTTVTAQGRKDPTQNSGFSIQLCNISADYLGRPWKLYSRTVVMQSYISGAVRPQGWLEWNGNFAIESLYYGEYKNYGPGSGLGGRVKWPGYHVLSDLVEARKVTVAEFIMGNSWLPATGVEYEAGLKM